jgi:hypothetical protein
VVGALVALFLGERVLNEWGVVRLVISSLGGLLLLAATGWRAVMLRRTTGEAHGVERFLLAAYVGCTVAVLGFLLSSEDIMNWLGIAFREAEAERRYEVALQVLSSIVLAVSLLPAIGAQWAIAAHRHAKGSAGDVESLRIRETATGGLTIALALAMLFLVGYTASERNKSADLSYFKTASPGAGTREVVQTFSEPLRVMLFFPTVNAVKDEILGYFRQLADATGNVEVEEYDRMVSPQVAREYQVTSDGNVLLFLGDRSERWSVSPDLRVARSRLRTLDREVQEHLFRVAREPRTAYLTVGHGEQNDPMPSEGASETDPLGGSNGIRELLGLLNYRVENLGLQQGLGRHVPDDAAMVIVLGPERAFLAEELDALDRYLARGGALLLALDPESEFRLGPLEGRFGLTYRSVALADDRQHLRRRGNLSDRQLIVTDRFSAHEAVTTLSRTRVGSGILLVGAGYFEQVGEDGPRRSFLIRSLPSTFPDLNGNYEFDPGSEERNTYPVVVAVEGRSSTDGGDQGGPGATDMRALVYADAGMFSDAVLASIGLNAALVADGFRWLGRDESISGEIESEADVAIVHTKAEDKAWFYLTIVGAPLLVFAVGLVRVVRRRRTGRTPR